MVSAPRQPDSDRAPQPASRPTMGQLLAWGTNSLAPSSASPRLDAELLLARLADTSRSTVMAFPERTIPQSLADEFRDQIHRRATGVPLAHLTGRKEFYSLELGVSRDTLVPRPETELLVDRLLECVTSVEEVRVLDAGTGCGAIALAVKGQRPRASVVAVDSSEAALRIASQNGLQLGLEIEWIVSDWFDALGDRQFDLIVSNPPYVERADQRLVVGDLRHEPRAALDGGIDGLDSIRRIIAEAPCVLPPGGRLLLEHGYAQAPAVAQLFQAAGFRSVATHRDLAGRNRVTGGRAP